MKSITLLSILVFAVVGCGSPKSNTNAKYVCPMHPEVTSDTMMKCPECGMDLEPVKPQPHDTSKNQPRP